VEQERRNTTHPVRCRLPRELKEDAAAAAAIQYRAVRTVHSFVIDAITKAHPFGAMETIGSDQPERAEQSCASCKRLKRRCSKDLPACQLCSRVGRRCDYSSIPSTPTRSDTEPRAERTGNRTGTPAFFPSRSDVSLGPFVSDVSSKASSELATCFLDSVATRGVEVTPPSTLLWRDVCPNGEDISKGEASNILDRYFSTTHSWLPIGMYLTDHRACKLLSNAWV